MIPALPQDVADVIAAWPSSAQTALHSIRDILWQTAADDPAIGHLTETLKWREPSWLTPSRSGTTLRVAWSPRSPGTIALLAHCQTTLMARVQDTYPDDFGFDGNRAPLMRLAAPLPVAPLRHVIRLGLTYHRRQAV